MLRIVHRLRRRLRLRVLGGPRREYAKYKEAARELVLARLAYWNKSYGLLWGRVAIRNQKSRWGSCSKRGNLNFNYRIIQLPPHLQDYLIVHELCHLQEHNHSRAFWSLVSRTIPNPSLCRTQLRHFQTPPEKLN